MHASDQPFTLLPEGAYDFILREVSGDISRYKRTPFVRLNFSSAAPIANDMHEVVCTIVGNWQHIHAWRRLIGQTFRLRIRHRELGGDTKVLDPVVME